MNFFFNTRSLCLIQFYTHKKYTFFTFARFFFMVLILISILILFLYLFLLIIQTHTLALLKSAVGLAVGGLAGLMFFRSGKGNRIGAMAGGLGAAFGSTYERVKFRYESQSKAK